MGFKVAELRCSHRPRLAGTTKYGFGIVQRALPGLIDLFAVRYLRNRRCPVTSTEIEACGLTPSIELRTTAPQTKNAAPSTREGAAV
jgi:hypothetical protein